MTDADDTAVDMLDAMGIDSAELRWLAVRDYIAELEREADRKINAVWLIATFLDLCETNAHRRGEPPWRCVGEDPCACAIPGIRACARLWGPRLIAADYLTARSVALAPYKGKARERGLDVLDPFMLPMLRKGAK
jgi:hypothetical protein